MAKNWDLQEFTDNSGGSDLDKNNVVKTDSVKGVEERKLTLDLVGLDHAFQDIADSQGLSLPRKVVGNGKDGTEVIGGMSPFRSEPAVIEIEPADLRPDIECTPDRVKLVVGSRDASSYNNRAFNGMTCK